MEAWLSEKSNDGKNEGCLRNEQSTSEYKETEAEAEKQIIAPCTDAQAKEDEAPIDEAPIATEIDDQAAAEKEKENAAAQRQAGGVVVLRMSGTPVDVEHDINAKTVKFKTFCAVGAPEALVKSGVLYYEFEVLTNDSEGAVAQIGFALNNSFQRQEGRDEQDGGNGAGCGDNDKSWGLDGTRCLKWFDGGVSPNGQVPEWPCQWATGDVIGVAAHVDAGKIAISKNGNWSEEACGVVFQDDKIKEGVYPCLSAGGGFSLRYAFKDLKYEVPSPDTVPFKQVYYQDTKNY